MAVVNTNVSASIAQSALARNDRALGTAMEQLSTGRKINSAGDNASGLAITARMTSQIKGLDTAIRNANDAVSMISTAEGALDEISNMLQRMRELAVQAGTGTTDSADRTYMNTEFSNLRSEIDRIADNTQWNGRNILMDPLAPQQVSPLSHFRWDLTLSKLFRQHLVISTTLPGNSLD